MKLTTAISLQINSIIESSVELGVATMRALLGAEPPLVPVAVANRPNAVQNLASHGTGFDSRLDAIRRAGL